MNAPTVPARGQWIAITFENGDSTICRFVRLGVNRENRRRYWYVDHGAYGQARHDVWYREKTIVATAPAARPALLLSYTDPFGRLKHIGRFATHNEADRAAHFVRGFAQDVRVEAAP